MIRIANRQIGPGQACFLIAEAGVNHNGSPELAHRLVDLAADAGADAVKFQTFKADRLVTSHAPKAQYQKVNTGTAESQLDMLRRLELSPELHQELIQHCQRRGIIFLSTPFEEQSADLLVNLNVQSLKIPSGEITNLPFLRHVASHQIPVILSTGMAALGEVERAVNEFRAVGNHSLALLQCVSNYPADPADCNLRAMATMQAAFGFPVGFSDHTLGNEVAQAAVALGACIIEKHFTTDRRLPGPDHAASMEPEELAALIRGIRKVESAMGNGIKLPAASEADTAAVARKSLVAARHISRGTILTEDLVAIMRPGTGIPPERRSFFLGKTIRNDVAAGSLFTEEMFA